MLRDIEKMRSTVGWGVACVGAGVGPGDGAGDGSGVGSENPCMVMYMDMCTDTGKDV